MDPHQLQVITLQYLQRGRHIGIPDAVLAVFAAGIGFLAMTVAKTGVHAQPDAVAGRHLTQLFQHIHRTGVDRDLQLMHARKRRVVDHVGGKDNCVTVGFRIKPGRQRALNFAKRNGVNLYPQLAHQAQNMNIRAGFLGKTHHVELMQRGDLLANDLRVVDPHRAAEFGRQAQQVIGVQISVSLVQRAWHGYLRGMNHFL